MKNTHELWEAATSQTYYVEHTFKVPVPTFAIELVVKAQKDALERGVPDYSEMELDRNEYSGQCTVRFSWTEAMA